MKGKVAVYLRGKSAPAFLLRTASTDTVFYTKSLKDMFYAMQGTLRQELEVSRFLEADNYNFHPRTRLQAISNLKSAAPANGGPRHFLTELVLTSKILSVPYSFKRQKFAPQQFFQNIDCTVEEYVKEGETDKSERVDGISIHWYKRFVKGQYPIFLASPDEDHELTRDILFIHTTQFINHIIEAISSCRTREH